MIRIKKKESILILYSFTPSDINFKTIFNAQSDFGKVFVTKKLLLSYILNLSALYLTKCSPMKLKNFLQNYKKDNEVTKLNLNLTTKKPKNLKLFHTSSQTSTFFPGF